MTCNGNDVCNLFLYGLEKTNVLNICIYTEKNGKWEEEWEGEEKKEEEKDKEQREIEGENERQYGEREG